MTGRSSDPERGFVAIPKATAAAAREALRAAPAGRTPGAPLPVGGAFFASPLGPEELAAAGQRGYILAAVLPPEGADAGSVHLYVRDHARDGPVGASEDENCLPLKRIT